MKWNTVERVQTVAFLKVGILCLQDTSSDEVVGHMFAFNILARYVWTSGSRHSGVKSGDVTPHGEGRVGFICLFSHTRSLSLSLTHTHTHSLSCAIIHSLNYACIISISNSINLPFLKIFFSFNRAFLYYGRGCKHFDNDSQVHCKE